MTEPIPPATRPGDMIRRMLAVAAFSTLVMVAAPVTQAFACSCVQLAAGQALANADLAFEGTVATVAITPSVAGRDTSNDPIQVIFTVETVLKGTPGGPAGPQILVSTANNSAVCGIEFTPGQRWRVYATVPAGGGNPSTSLCSGDELLGQGNVPAPAGGGPPLAILFGGGAALGLVAFGAWAFTRRPRGELA